MFSRTIRVIGKDNFKKLQNATVAVLGVGGVGGYVSEMLCRMGIENLTLVDFDSIDISNLNRQIIATTQNIGKLKVEEFKKRLLSINPNCKVTIYNTKLDNVTIPQIINCNYNFVADCIDDISAKVCLAKFCTENKINIVSSMGTGNRYRGNPQFEITDISKTSYDKLAKKLRKLLKDEGITHLPVCYTKNPPEKTEDLGSVVYYPLMCAGVITSYIVNKILENN